MVMMLFASYVTLASVATFNSAASVTSLDMTFLMVWPQRIGIILGQEHELGGCVLSTHVEALQHVAFRLGTSTQRRCNRLYPGLAVHL